MSQRSKAGPVGPAFFCSPRYENDHIGALDLSSRYPIGHPGQVSSIPSEGLPQQQHETYGDQDTQKTGSSAFGHSRRRGIFPLPRPSDPAAKRADTGVMTQFQ